MLHLISTADAGVIDQHLPMVDIDDPVVILSPFSTMILPEQLGRLCAHTSSVFILPLDDSKTLENGKSLENRKLLEHRKLLERNKPLSRSPLALTRISHEKLVELCTAHTPVLTWY